MIKALFLLIFFISSCLFPSCHRKVNDNEYIIHLFDKIQLDFEFYSEGIDFGDVNNDGIIDIVSGP